MATVEEQIQRPGTRFSSLSDYVAVPRGHETAVALPHCSESTKESIAGWWTFGLEVRLELWRNYRTSYVKKTEVEVLPVVDLSAESFFYVVFFGEQCNTGERPAPVEGKFCNE